MSGGLELDPPLTFQEHVEALMDAGMLFGEAVLAARAEIAPPDPRVTLIRKLRADGFLWKQIAPRLGLSMAHCQHLLKAP